ncbi:pantoate--beta-alanine ligase [bacterium]|nr:MAG: pantoate--beta-alanine ligase [bacterium]
MKIITTIEQMQENSSRLRNEGDRIGFVPTMGFLHEGHLSLMRRAREENHTLVASIFVNPTQFGPDEDFKDYPREMERDSVMCREEGVDLLFAPSTEQMYPDNFRTTVHVSHLTEVLCGRSRIGHFDGVTTVVAKLFSIVRPHKAYFGLKDYQQYRVISRMTRDLDMDIDVVGMPIIREEDGLAMSSRNTYLSMQERQSALSLNRSLREAEQMVADGILEAEIIKSRVRGIIEAEAHTRIDYIQIVDMNDLTDVQNIEGQALLALAVHVGNARLIDNTKLVSALATQSKK